MATRPVGEKRGPKIGDAASLWNFTPSPGWTKEEAQVLKLCLMKLGIGRWVQILETGLLPGKLIQQLNGQTQRLLGQQSLAAYTGLQVDIDRIRADNETRTDAPRKAGLIINTGANLTKDVKEKMQEEARIKYGLTTEQIREVDEQLEELAATAQVTAGGTTEDAALMAADPHTLSKEDKLNVLRLLHSRLEKLQGKLTEHAQQAIKTVEAQPNDDSNRENNAVNAPASTAVAPRSMKPGNRNGKRKSSEREGKKVRGRAKKLSSEDDSDVEMEEAAGVAEAQGAAFAADVSTLLAMGFDERQARDALEEAEGSVEMAAEWLMTHCV